MTWHDCHIILHYCYLYQARLRKKECRMPTMVDQQSNCIAFRKLEERERLITQRSAQISPDWQNRQSRLERVAVAAISSIPHRKEAIRERLFEINLAPLGDFEDREQFMIASNFFKETALTVSVRVLSNSTDACTRCRPFTRRSFRSNYKYYYYYTIELDHLIRSNSDYNGRKLRRIKKRS